MLAVEGEAPHHILVFELEDIPDCCKIRLLIARKIPVILEVLPSILVPNIKKLLDLDGSHLANTAIHVQAPDFDSEHVVKLFVWMDLAEDRKSTRLNS